MQPARKRVMRLLGWNGTPEESRGGLAGSFVLFVERCWQPTLSWVAHAAGEAPLREGRSRSSSVIVVTRGCSAERTHAPSRENQRPLSAGAEPQPNPASEPQTANDGKKQSYMDARRRQASRLRTGRTHFPEDSGVTPEYIKGMHDLIATQRGRTHRDESTGITPEYVREMRKFDRTPALMI